MPKKLQLKLLSNSGELLNVVNCFAGQVAVFRANSPADLRPYQRALTGSQGKERFNVSVDGLEYDPEKHVLIGLGEQPPHSGLTVQQFLTEVGVPEDSVFALLSSYGLEHTLDRKCSSTTADEERRIRLLAATCCPHKILVTNEPFEPIVSQWKERFAELLSTYARQKNAIVVVTALSSRPESWIDNEAISRVQVGETIQRTIGFGSAGSESTALMNQLKDLFRDEAKVQELLHKNSTSADHPSNRIESIAPGAALSGASLMSMDDLSHEDFTDELPDTASFSEYVQSGSLAKAHALWAGTSKNTLGAFAFGCVGIAAFYSAFVPPSTEKPEVQASLPAPSVTGALPGDRATTPPALGPALIPAQQAEAEGGNPPNSASAPQLEVVGVRYILDEYPEPIKISLLDTARGVVAEPSLVTERSEPEVTRRPQTKATGGNLFKLLESASTNQGDKTTEESAQPQGIVDQGTPPSSWNEPSEEGDADPNDEQQRREAIRQKFLEAIRAAAEKRQATLEGG